MSLALPETPAHTESATLLHFAPPPPELGSPGGGALLPRGRDEVQGHTRHRDMSAAKNLLLLLPLPVLAGTHFNIVISTEASRLHAARGGEIAAFCRSCINSRREHHKAQLQTQPQTSKASTTPEWPAFQPGHKQPRRRRFLPEAGVEAQPERQNCFSSNSHEAYTRRATSIRGQIPFYQPSPSPRYPGARYQNRSRKSAASK
jgi:hypothetical protein